MLLARVVEFRFPRDLLENSNPTGRDCCLHRAYAMSVLLCKCLSGPDFRLSEKITVSVAAFAAPRDEC